MASTVLEQLAEYGPDHCRALSYEQARAYTRELARTHYENFTVVSWLLPAPLRDDFRNVYAFCRWADDLGDEVGDRQRSLQLLGWWSREIDLCYAGRPRHPVFVALRETIGRHDIPRKPFDDLVAAFVQDQTATRYETWAQVLDYCTRSADPVGRLVLYLCGYRDARRQKLSDRTCTALQLANFWQDVRRDVLERDRVYIPREVADEFGLDLERMVQAIRADAEKGSRQALEAVRGPARATVRELVDRTWPLFAEGRRLWPLVDGQVRADIKLFTLGGESILRLIEKQGYDTLQRRPALSTGRKVRLLLGAAAGRFLSFGGRRQRGAAGMAEASHA